MKRRFISLFVIVKYIYKHSDRILVSSNGFINSIVDKGISKDKIEFFPQWAEPIFKPMKSNKFLLTGVPEKSFKIMFAGNIGEAQDFPSIIEAARQLRHNQDIQWVVLGGGRREEYIISPGLRPERDIQPFEFTVKFLLRRSK